MAYFPDSSPGSNDKAFNFHGASVKSLFVEGVPQHQIGRPGDINVLSATATGVLGAGCSSRMIAGGRPIFTSSKVTTKTSLNLKIVRATMITSAHGKPDFHVQGQVFTQLTDETANVPHLMSVITNEWGPGYALATKDGLTISDSDGTRGNFTKLYSIVHTSCVYISVIGLNFRKVGSRKIFAVTVSSLSQPGPSGTKRKRLQVAHDSDVTSNSDEDESTKPKKSCAIASELKDLKDKIQDIIEIKAGTTKVPIGLLMSIKSAFRCTISSLSLNPH